MLGAAERDRLARLTRDLERAHALGRAHRPHAALAERVIVVEGDPDDRLARARGQRSRPAAERVVADVDTDGAAPASFSASAPASAPGAKS